MKKVLLAMLAMAGFTLAQAQVTGNLGLTSDYRFRGVSQSQNAPAVQGGVDYAHSSGFYIGNWNSSVSSQVYTAGAGLESDLYAGYKKEIFKGITVDIGTYNYFYPRATTSAATGSNLKRPQPEGGKRRDSYCARSAGQMKMFPEAAKDPKSRLRLARKAWDC